MAERSDGRPWGIGLAGAGLAAVTFWFGGSAGRPADPPAAAAVRQGAATSRPLARGHDTGERLVREFVGEERDQPLALDALIATLPDPFDSHLDYSYDAQLEAIQLAFGDAGWLLDRFWVPRREDSAWVATGNGRDSVRAPAHEVRPGVILFRRVGRAPRDGGPPTVSLRLVYLVPEMPTGGVHKEALRAALVERERLRAEFRPDGAGPGADTVRMIGPSFSGAALSIVQELRAWLAERPGVRVRLVSGTATSLSLPLVQSTRAERIDFATTIAPDYLLDAVLRCEVLPRLGLAAREVLLLVESSTEYGQTLEETPGAPCGSGSVGESFRVVRFPVAIASLRAEYARHPEASAPARALPGAPAAPRIPLALADPSDPKERPPLRSPLTPAALDLELASIVRLLRDTEVRAVGILASDVRDKLFLGQELRKRLRDVQLFTFESELLYARTDYGESLSGMLVFSSYPLVSAAQLSGGEAGSPGWMIGRSDGAVGIYNATLASLGDSTRMREYGAPSRATTVPPVWLTVVGRGMLAPVTVFPDSPGWPRTIRIASARPATPWPVLPVGVFAWLVMLAAAAVTIGFGSSLLRRVVTGRVPWGRPDADVLDGESIPRSAFSVPGRGRASTPAAGAAVGDDPRWSDAACYERVRGASLLVHRWLYRALLLVSLLAILLPPLTLVQRAHALRHPTATSGVDLFAHLGVAALSLAALLGLVGIGVSLVAAVVHLAGTASDGLRFVARRREDWPLARRAGWLAEIVLRGAVVGLGLWYASLVLRFSARIGDLAERRADAFALYFYRAVHFESGVSPLVPVALAGLGFVAWCTWHRARIRGLRETSPFEAVCLRHDASSPAAAGLAPGTAPRVARRGARAIADVRASLFLLVPEWRGAVLATLLVATGAWFWSRFGRTAESVILDAAPGAPGPFETLLRFGVVVLLAATVWGVYRLLLVWLRLRAGLDEISDLPLVTAFERLTPRVSRLTRLSFFSPRSAHIIEAATTQQWSHLVEIHEKRWPEFVRAFGPGSAVPTQLWLLMQRSPAPPRSLAHWEQEVRRLETLAAVLAEMWREEPTSKEIDEVAEELSRLDARNADDEKPVTVSTSSRIRRTFTGPVRLWLRGAEEYAAVRVVEYVEWVLRHLRRLAGFLLLALLLGTAMLSSYPFQPQSRARLGLFAVLVAAVVALLFVMSQMNRNEVLSRITKTDPGRITWNTPFVVNVLLFAVVPLLALLSSEFPEARGVLFGWVEPLLRTFGRS